MKKYYILFLFTLIFISLFGLSYANQEPPRLIKGIEVLTGYGWSSLKKQEDLCLYPLILGLNFDFKNILKKIGLNPWMFVDFQLEPYIAGVSSPEKNVEVGNAFCFKIGILPEEYSFQPYFKVACGMLYMTQHTYEQGSQFNFYEYGAGGLSWFFNKNTALTVEYRFRHLSNLGIKKPNSGINTSFVVAGISCRF